MSNANILIYLVTAIFIAIAAIVAFQRMEGRKIGRLGYLALLAPSFMLVFFGMKTGIGKLPKHKFAIHGYRVPLSQNNRSFTLGSGANDDIRFSRIYEGEELIEQGLARVSFPQQNRIEVRIDEEHRDTPNVIMIDNRPIRSLPLTPGEVHEITFERYNYSKEYVLEVEIEGRKPVFRYKGKEFTRGFHHPILFNMLSLPVDSGKFKHLGWRNRIDLGPLTPELKQSALYWTGGREILSVYWTGGEVWLCANDAQIRLDDKDFPLERVVEKKECKIALYSRHIGNGRSSREFTLFSPYSADFDDDEGGLEAHIDLSEKSKKYFAIADEGYDNLCLTSGAATFRKTRDIRDLQFPRSGVLLKNENGRYVFRGQYLEYDKPYSCGKTFFSVDRVRKPELFHMALFCSLFLCAALFFPVRSLKKEPLTAVILGSCIYLLALRQLLAFRAWQAEPYNQSAFLDSAISPYLFVLAVFIVSDYYPVFLALKVAFVKFYNALTGGGMYLKSEDREEYEKMKGGGRMFLGIILYGVLLLGFFSKGGGLIEAKDFLFVFGLVFLSLVLRWFDKVDTIIVEKMIDPGGLWGIILLSGLAIAAIMGIPPLLGSREVISFIPGRPRPDIVLQILFLFLTAFMADYWNRQYGREELSVVKLLFSFALPMGLCFFQSVLARDMGFVVMVWPTMFFIMLASTWKMDNKLRLLIWCGISVIGAGLYIVYSHPEYTPVGYQSLNRILFILEPERLKAQNFFNYMAHLPILWSSTQGFFGAGFFDGLLDRSLYGTCVNDNVASVFLQGELGVIGTTLVMGVYMTMCSAGMLFVSEGDRVGKFGTGFRLWIVWGLSFMIFWAAFYMVTANMGYLPLTGKNLPLLGLDSKNDVIRYGILVGFIIRYIRIVSKG